MPNPKFLDTTGLNQLWGKIKSALGNKLDKNLGAANSGKFLSVDSSGNVELADIMTSIFNDVSFSIDTTDWVGSQAPYTAAVSISGITSNSYTWTFFDKSYETYAHDIIDFTPTTGYMTFTTNVRPTGTITGTVRIAGNTPLSTVSQAVLNQVDKVANLTVSAEAATGSTPDAVLIETGSPAHKHITFKLVKGDKGDTGNTGATPQLSIGTVTTLQPSQDATVTITGTDEEPVLNFGIPQGASGNETIDDTAGLGDTDLVYSADKVVKLFRSEHEDLTSGNAEQVIGKVASTEKGAYLYRRGMHLGNRCRENVVGGTVAWNQLVQNGNFASTSNWAISSYYKVTSSLSVSNNKATVVGDSSSSGGLELSQSLISFVNGHKYILFCKVKSSVACKISYIIDSPVYTNIASGKKDIPVNANEKADIVNFVSLTATATTSIRIISTGTTNGGTFEIEDVQVFDLTAMFGSVIADTLYGMGEAGVAWFRERFSKDYYAYDAGSLQSVQAGAKKTWVNLVPVSKDTGNGFVANYYLNKNGTAYSESACDVSEYFKVKGNTVYHWTIDGNSANPFGICWYDSSKTYISGEQYSNRTNETITTPANAVYGRVTLSHDSVNSVWDEAEVHTYPFDTSLTLRGIPKLDSNNRLYYDGDEYESSGKVTRKYGIVDLGSLTWIKDTNASNLFRTDGIDRIKKNGNTNIVCQSYVVTNESLASSPDKSIRGHNSYGYIYVKDSAYSTAWENNTPNDFKTAMSGVYLVYELATPTTEQASPFTPIMSFDHKGTEEFTEWGTRDVAIPVGHITEYLTDPAKILNNIPLIEVEKESASVVTFSDGAEGLPLKELTVKVEPVQDLHGYDNPWPTGGGKNKYPIKVGEDVWGDNTASHSNESGVLKITFQANKSTPGVYSSGSNKIKELTANQANSITISFYAYATTQNDFYIGNGNYPKSVTFKTTKERFYVTIPANTNYTFVIYQQDTNKTANTVYISDVQVESGDSMTTFAPYSNICPISGWTGAKVTRTGKNILKLFDTDSTHRGVPITKENGVVKRVGTWDSTNTVSGFSITGTTISLGNYSNYNNTTEDNTIKLKPGTYTLTAKATKSTNASSLQVYCATFRSLGGNIANEIGMIGYTYGDIINQTKTYSFTLTEEAYFYCGINSAVSSDGTAVDWAIEVQLEIGNSASAFVPYIGSTTEYAFPSEAGTVYGGTLTVNKDGSGELVVDRKKVTFNGSENFSSASNNRWYIEATGFGGITSDAICDRLGFDETIYNLDKTGFYIGGSNPKNIYFRISEISSVADFKTWLGTNNTTVVYPLATTVTYQLTPVEVETMLGINNIWADTGNVSLTYRADTKKYIDAKFAELSAAITALGT